MQTIQGLQRRIESTEDLLSVAKTMKALAAVNIQQYEQAVQSLEDYFKSVEMGLSVLLKARSQRQVLSRQASPERVGAIVFGSDQGMCGPLYEQVGHHALQVLDKLPLRNGAESPQKQCTILAVGERIAAFLEDAGRPPADTLTVPGSAEEITPLVQHLVLTIEQWGDDQGIQ